MTFFEMVRVQKSNGKCYSIEYFGVVLLWTDKIPNRRVIIFCDNEFVTAMINYSNSSCRKCLVLFRAITLHSMKTNVRSFCRHMASLQNEEADLLSRMRIKDFQEITPRTMSVSPEKIPRSLWPIKKSGNHHKLV